MSRTRLMAKYASTGVTSGEVDLLDDFSNTIAASLPVATANELGFFKSGSNLSIDGSNALNKTDTSYSTATTSASGLMPASDKSKLDGIADNANNYVLPAATSSALGGAKINSSSGITEVDGEFSVVSTFKAVYTDSISPQQTSYPSGYYNWGKFLGYAQYGSPTTGSLRMHYPTIASNGTYTSWTQIPNTTQFLEQQWQGSWGIWNSYGANNHNNNFINQRFQYYDANSNNNKGGGVELSIPSGFSTSDKIFLYFSAPNCFYMSTHTGGSPNFSGVNGHHIAGFRWQFGTDRWYEPYHAWGASGDWSNHSSGTSYVGGTLGEETNIKPANYPEALGTTNQNLVNPNFHTVANIPSSGAFKVRPWFRIGTSSGGYGANLSGAKFPSSGRIRLTAIITS